jgi:autotransporter-associated beta strand protein
MRKPSALRIVVAGAVFLAAASQAGSGRAQVTFDWATVGNPGNAPDTLVMDKPNGSQPGDGTSGYGSVAYTYRISKTHVTNAQYVNFLNAVDPNGTNSLLYITNMTNLTIGGTPYPAYTGGIDRNLAAAEGSRYSVKTGQENYPVVQINWSRAARFVNWLANGQGSGGTESGVYDMSVFTVNSFATPPPRAANATMFLPSENEWYKAAYYDPTKGGTGGYWQYGTRSDTAPASVAPPGSSNSANIGAGTTGASGGAFALTLATTGASFNKDLDYLTNVGAYTTSTSSYGLFDLDGTVFNWTEASRENRSFAGQYLPIYRGGMWQNNELNSGAAFRNTGNGAGVNTGQFQNWGFRVAGLVAVVTINVASGTQTQTQAGFPLLSGSTPVEKTGAGILVLDQANTLTAPITVTQGTLQLATANTLSTSAVTVAAGATLAVAPQVAAVVPTLTNDGLVDVGLGEITVVSGLTAEGLKAEIVAGRNEGAWDGATGITSSAAAGMTDRAVGWIDNGDGSFRFGFAAAGDLDMNGLVDLDDVIAFVGGGLYDTGSPAVWAQGDYDYNGIVDLDDVIAFVGGGLYDKGPYNQPEGGMSLMGFGGDTALMGGGFAAVPEPATWVLVAVGALCVAAWRRHASGWAAYLS